MSGAIGYALGYEDGRSSAEVSRGNRELFERAFSGARPVTVDQSYIDQLHAALAEARNASAHNYSASDRLYEEGAGWKQKAYQLRDEALYWRDQKYALVSAEAKALREENATLRDDVAILIARLKERNPDIAEEQAAHDETFKEKQSLHRFRVIAASLIDALLAGRANRPEFAELLNLAKNAADTIERGDLFTAFRDEPEGNNRLCTLADSLQKP
jgi:hypothetical protein